MSIGYPFNRTISELKPMMAAKSTRLDFTFNRTISELKHHSFECSAQMFQSFNRTISELKPAMNNNGFAALKFF